MAKQRICQPLIYKEEQMARRKRRTGRSKSKDREKEREVSGERWKGHGRARDRRGRWKAERMARTSNFCVNLFHIFRSNSGSFPFSVVNTTWHPASLKAVYGIAVSTEDN
jgi:hypothetical protein